MKKWKECQPQVDSFYYRVHHSEERGTLIN
jgi:hypothetical protein